MGHKPVFRTTPQPSKNGTSHNLLNSFLTTTPWRWELKEYWKVWTNPDNPISMKKLHPRPRDAGMSSFWPTTQIILYTFPYISSFWPYILWSISILLFFHPILLTSILSKLVPDATRPTSLTFDFCNTLGSWATRSAARSHVSSAARSQRYNCSSKLWAINPPSPADNIGISKC